MSQSLSAFVSNADGYVGRGVVAELTTFAERHKLALNLSGSALITSTVETTAPAAPTSGENSSTAAPAPPAAPVVPTTTISAADKAAAKWSALPDNSLLTIVPKDDELLNTIVKSELIVYDLFTADLGELERVIQKLKLVTDHSVIFVLISTVLTWDKSAVELEEIVEEVPPAPEGEEDEAAAEEDGEEKPPAESEPPKPKQFQPKKLTASYFAKRQATAKYRRWQTIETLVTSLNVKANIRSIVVSSGLLYGKGEMPNYSTVPPAMLTVPASEGGFTSVPSFSYLMKEAWLRNESFFATTSAENPNFLPTVHVNDACKLALQAAFFPDDEAKLALPETPADLIPEEPDEGEEEISPEKMERIQMQKPSTFDFKQIGKKGVVGYVVQNSKNNSKYVYCAVDESDMSSTDLLKIILTEFCGEPGEAELTTMLSTTMDDMLAKFGGEAAEEGEEEGEKPNPDLRKSVLRDVPVAGGDACSLDLYPELTKMNLRVSPCQTWYRIPEKHCAKGLFFTNNVRKIAKEYSKEINLKPIRSVFSGTPGCYLEMINSVSKEFEVEVISTGKMQMELAEWAKSLIPPPPEPKPAPPPPEDGEEEAPPPEEEEPEPVELPQAVVYLQERLDFEAPYSFKTTTSTVEEEGAEEGETVTKEVVEDIISEEEKKLLFSSLIEKKLMTSKSRYRGFLVELGDFPLKYEDALDLFTDKVPEVVKEEEEAGEEGEEAAEPVKEATKYTLKEFFPDVFVLASSSDDNAKKQLTANGRPTADFDAKKQDFAAKFRQPYKTQEDQQKAFDEWQQKTNELKEQYAAQIKELEQAAILEAKQQSEETGEEVEPKPIEPPEEPEYPEYEEPSFIQFPASHLFSSDKFLDGNRTEIELVGLLPTTKTNRVPELELDYILGADETTPERLHELLLNEFKIAFESVLNDKIFNFFPTEEELKAIEEKKRLEEEERKRLEEEEKKRVIYEKEEKLLKMQNTESNSRLAEIESKTAEELQNLSLPLKNYMQEHVVPEVVKGLIEVCKVMPEDPVDYLAEYLFTHSSNIPPLPQ